MGGRRADPRGRQCLTTLLSLAGPRTTDIELRFGFQLGFFWVGPPSLPPSLASLLLPHSSRKTDDASVECPLCSLSLDLVFVSRSRVL